MRVDRDGTVGVVTIQNHAFLNSEDDVSTAALEVAVDLVLLDDSIEVGVLRGAPATHPEARRPAHLRRGHQPHPPVLREDLAGRVHDRAGARRWSARCTAATTSATPTGGVLEDRREKPWIAAVESFAIGGACQWLLVMDRVIAEEGSYFNLPARKEGIIPGCANLRLPRFVGERLTRQAIFFNRVFEADSAEGRLIADEVVPADEIDGRDRAGGGGADERRHHQPGRQPQGAARGPRAARRRSAAT